MLLDRLRALGTRLTGTLRRGGNESWDWPSEVHHTFDQVKRIKRAMSMDTARIIKINALGVATIRGKTGVYQTTLRTCSCPDFARRKLPCKHIYLLARAQGLLPALPRRKPKARRTMDPKQEVKRFVELYEAGEITYEDMEEIGNAIYRAKKH